MESLKITNFNRKRNYTQILQTIFSKDRKHFWDHIMLIWQTCLFVARLSFLRLLSFSIASFPLGLARLLHRTSKKNSERRNDDATSKSSNEENVWPTGRLCCCWREGLRAVEGRAKRGGKEVKNDSRKKERCLGWLETTARDRKTGCKVSQFRKL